MDYNPSMENHDMDPADRSNLEGPISDCLLLCDDVTLSHKTGKRTLVGIIGGIAVPRFPARIGGFVAYLRLRNVYPHQKIRLVFRRASDDSEVASFGLHSPKKSDPLGQHTLIIPIPRFPVTDPGWYLFSAEHDGAPIVVTRIEVQIPPADREQ